MPRRPSVEVTTQAMHFAGSLKLNVSGGEPQLFAAQEGGREAFLASGDQAIRDFAMSAAALAAKLPKPKRIRTRKAKSGSASTSEAA